MLAAAGLALTTLPEPFIRPKVHCWPGFCQPRERKKKQMETELKARAGAFRLTKLSSFRAVASMATAALLMVVVHVMPGLSSRALCSENRLLQHPGAALLWELSVSACQAVKDS